jgi:hypothetical protein
MVSTGNAPRRPGSSIYPTDNRNWLIRVPDQRIERDIIAIYTAKINTRACGRN